MTEQMRKLEEHLLASLENMLQPLADHHAIARVDAGRLDSKARRQWLATRMADLRRQDPAGRGKARDDLHQLLSLVLLSGGTAVAGLLAATGARSLLDALTILRDPSA